MSGGAGHRLAQRLAPVTGALVVATALVLVAGCTPRKKLLEWGWDEPDTSFLRRNLAALQATPFDGCVFHALTDDGSSFSWRFWSRHAFGERELARAFADLQATDLGRFRDSFLRVNVTPGELDWFEDFTPVLANARTAGRLARTARARGVVLDVEQYEGAVFDYARQRFAPARSWNSYATQARRRGRELIGALQQGQPDLTLLLSFGHSLPWVQSQGGRLPLAGCTYGLLAPFVDGLLEGARGRTRVVDGYELSYGLREEAAFADARRLVFAEALTLSAARDAYRRRLRLGFGIWLDYDWRRRGFSAGDTARNYVTPATLERVVAAALRASDEYVWVYAETPRWWGARAPGERMPIAYDAALRRALASAR